MNYNGSDTIGLWCNGSPNDVIGRIGIVPNGGAWGTGQLTTADRILRRDCNVTVGDSNPNDAYDPATTTRASPWAK